LLFEVLAMTRAFSIVALLPILSAAVGSPVQEPTSTPTPLPTATSSAAPVAGLPTPTPAPSDTPKPAPELAKLQFLVGEWVHDEIDHTAPTGTGSRRAARSRIGWILGGQWLYITYKSAGATDEFEGRGLIGWDSVRKSYRLDWFDGRGEAQRYDGSFDPEETLVFDAEFKVGGERRRQQLSIKKQPGGKFLLMDSSSAGDAPLKLTLESLAQTAPPPTPTPTPTVASGGATPSTTTTPSATAPGASGSATATSALPTPTASPTPTLRSK
jgi:hypothetical protein